MGVVHLIFAKNVENVSLSLLDLSFIYNLPFRMFVAELN